MPPLTKRERERAAVATAARKWLRRSKKDLKLTDKQYEALLIGMLAFIQGWTREEVE